MRLPPTTMSKRRDQLASIHGVSLDMRRPWFCTASQRCGCVVSGRPVPLENAPVAGNLLASVGAQEQGLGAMISSPGGVECFLRSLQAGPRGNTEYLPEAAPVTTRWERQDSAAHR